MKGKNNMKTYKVIRTETITEEQIVQADNEEQAIDQMKYENWDNAQVLSSECDVEEINEK
jgi:hypothetical protein|tara:strand:- start:142 stop:321 length:180 start_codon:yes stop_codon:yes gene_type:complete